MRERLPVTKPPANGYETGNGAGDRRSTVPSTHSNETTDTTSEPDAAVLSLLELLAEAAQASADSDSATGKTLNSDREPHGASSANGGSTSEDLVPSRVRHNNSFDSQNLDVDLPQSDSGSDTLAVPRTANLSGASGEIPLTVQQLTMLRQILVQMMPSDSSPGTGMGRAIAHLNATLQQPDPIMPSYIVPDLLTLLHDQTGRAQGRSPQPHPVAPARSDRSGLFSSVAILGIGIGLVVLAITQYRARVANNIEQDIQLTLAATPMLSTYYFQPQVRNNAVQLGGRLPSQSLRAYAAEVVQQAFPNLKVDNDIIVVDAVPDPDQLAVDVQQVVQAFNQFEGVDITAEVEGDRALLKGRVLAPVDVGAIVNSIQQLPGISQVEDKIDTDDATINTRLYFEADSSQIRPEDFDLKLAPIADWLRTYPTLSLNIIGYAHPDETDDPTTLAYARAQAVQVSLEEQDVDLRRLSIRGQTDQPPGVIPEHPQWRYQTVLFELTDKGETQAD